MANDTSVPADYTAEQRQILGALREQIEPTRSTFMYKLALLGVAGLNLVLPVIYFGLIVLVGHAIYWNWKYFGPDRGGHFVVQLGSTLLAGATLIFLIKPLFARDPKASIPLKIKSDAEPFLYEYVRTICELVKAPVPRTIRLMCEPNAYASFSGGMFGLVTGRMELTIGLPLVTGMSVRQLTGILAHEFGHFSQGGAMRLSFIVRIINAWLFKIVFLRDALDAKLEELSEGGDIRLWPFVKSMQFCIFLSRQLLFGVAWLGNAVSCFLLRQMEYDADRYEARTVGFRTFSSTFSRIQEIGIAHQMALGDLDTFHSEGRLPDNLPLLVVSNVKRITPELRKAFRKLAITQQTGLFDSHPSDRDRIDSARQESAAGVFQLTSQNSNPPATVLFANLERICRGITVDFYKEQMGRSFQKKLVYPANELISRRDAEFEAGKALDRYFQVHIPIDRPLPLDAESLSPPPRPQEALQNLKEARERMLAALVEYKPLPERYQHASAAQYNALEALAVIDSELKYRGKDFGLPNNRPETAQSQLKRVRAAVQHLAARMLTFESAASERLGAALRLLQVPKVAAAIPDGTAWQTEARMLIKDGRLISEMIGELPALQMLFRRTGALLSHLGNNRPQRVIEKIVGQLEAMSSQLKLIHDQLEGKPYSFDHADDTVTLQHFVIPYVPEPMDLAGQVAACERLVDRLYTLQIRIFARLSQMAEKVESVLGLAPLPDPEPEPSEK
jgi:Zn-dependent protease with chaperone function